MIEMPKNDSLWLVKSSGRILGPFTTAKIADLLRTREISVLDEIAPPLRRWQTIQYHDELRDVVEGLRRANLSERTEATWTPHGTMGLTQTLTDVETGDLTEELTGGLDGFTATQKEIVVHDVHEQSHVSATASGAGRFQPSQNQNAAVQRQVEKTTRGLWIVTVLILLGAAAFILQRRINSGANLDARSPGAKKSAIINQVQVGHYAEALRELKSQFPDASQAGDLAVYFGSLLIQVEGQTVVGRRALNSIVSARRPDLKLAYAGLGVADLIDGQLDSAQDNFNQALKIDPEYIPAVTNLAAMNIQKGNYADAKEWAIKALHLNPLQGEALLLLAEAQLYLYKSDGDVNQLTQIGQRIKEFRTRNWDFASELGFYQLYYDFIRRDPSFAASMQAYLDTDPTLTQNHRHSLFIYKGRAQWKVLARLCEQMADQMGDRVNVANFLASCYSHEGRWDAARRSVEKAVHQAPKDPLTQAWYSYVLRESGDVDQASVVLGRATEMNRRGEFKLPTLLQARFCQQAGLFDCARENWQKLYERDLDFLPAVSGLAWVHAEAKSRAESLKLINKGLRLSHDFIPLLELRQRAETEGWYAAN